MKLLQMLAVPLFAIGVVLVPLSLSSETAYAVTCHFKGDAKIGPEKNCFYDCLGKKVWIVIPSRKKCPLTVQGDMTIVQLSRTEQVPTASKRQIAGKCICGHNGRSQM
jgi:hypothetical protein